MTKRSWTSCCSTGDPLHRDDREPEKGFGPDPQHPAEGWSHRPPGALPHRFGPREQPAPGDRPLDCERAHPGHARRPPWTPAPGLEHRGGAERGIYHAAKHSVLGLTKSVGLEGMLKGVPIGPLFCTPCTLRDLGRPRHFRALDLSRAKARELVPSRWRRRWWRVRCWMGSSWSVCSRPARPRTPLQPSAPC